MGSDVTASGNTVPASLAAARLIIAALHDAGVQHIVYAPGSRNAPFAPVLAAADAAGYVRVRVVVDERSAGFVALGAARAGRADCPQAAAVITTSGTAVANLHPAVAEADAAGIPLIVISADRPHELVGTGANQTTEQVSLFGRAMRAVVDLPADLAGDTMSQGEACGAETSPEAQRDAEDCADLAGVENPTGICVTAGPSETTAGAEAARRVAALEQQQRRARLISGQVRRVVAAAHGTLSNDPGPAHLNVRFRPPLALPDVAASAAVAPWLASVGRKADVAGQGPEGWTEAQLCALSPNESEHDQRASNASSQMCGVVVAGDALQPCGELAIALAEELSWPLLAEPTSGARQGSAALTGYADLLASPAGRELTGAIAHVVVVGRPTLSRPIAALLGRGDLPIDVVSATARWADTAGTARHVVTLRDLPDGSVSDRVRALAHMLGLGRAPASWQRQWMLAQAQADDGVRGDRAGEGVDFRTLTPETVAWEIWHSCHGGDDVPRLVVGASMPIRLLDRFAPPLDCEVASNSAVRAESKRDSSWGLCPTTPLANRGLAGIDGTLATAIGVWWRTGRPVRAFVGDLTFLHDAMSLNRGETEAEPDLHVVVLDNGGGAIFSTLEYPAVTPAETMRRFFATPQRTDRAALARSLGARVCDVDTAAGLREALAAPVRGLNVTIVTMG